MRPFSSNSHSIYYILCFESSKLSAKVYVLKINYECMY